MCYLFIFSCTPALLCDLISISLGLSFLTKQRYHLSTLTVFIRINEIIWCMFKQHMVGTKGLNSLLFLYLHLFFFFFFVLYVIIMPWII